MFNPFKAIGDMQQFQQKAQAMQKALAAEEVVVERNGVRIVMSGDQKVKEIEVDGVMENRIAEAFAEAIKKTQEIAARKLMEMQEQES
ncbi:MAG: YbaB/EbfC family nucleoid-associated protein [Candidatus Roizmanbacteria bacterium]|nr:YbaB/EbfC family nucleoid-associated protein [Candidatus Roizmanbacteria bacterium]